MVRRYEQRPIRACRSGRARPQSSLPSEHALVPRLRTWRLRASDPKNPDSLDKTPYLDDFGPLKSWREVYAYDPLADIPESQQHLVVGGEVHVWAEQTDGVNLYNTLWPRVSAAGIVLWRGKGVVSKEVTRRLAEMREWLVRFAVAAGPIGKVVLDELSEKHPIGQPLTLHCICKSMIQKSLFVLFLHTMAVLAMHWVQANNKDAKKSNTHKRSNRAAFLIQSIPPMLQTPR